MDLVFCDYEKGKPETFSSFYLKLENNNIIYTFSNKDCVLSFSDLLDFLNENKIYAAFNESVNNFICESGNEDLIDLVKEMQ